MGGRKSVHLRASGHSESEDNRQAERPPSGPRALGVRRSRDSSPAVSLAADLSPAKDTDEETDEDRSWSETRAARRNPKPQAAADQRIPQQRDVSDSSSARIAVAKGRDRGADVVSGDGPRHAHRSRASVAGTEAAAAAAVRAEQPAALKAAQRQQQEEEEEAGWDDLDEPDATSSHGGGGQEFPSPLIHPVTSDSAPLTGNAARATVAARGGGRTITEDAAGASAVTLVASSAGQPTALKPAPRTSPSEDPAAASGAQSAVDQAPSQDSVEVESLRLQLQQERALRAASEQSLVEEKEARRASEQALGNEKEARKVSEHALVEELAFVREEARKEEERLRAEVAQAEEERAEAMRKLEEEAEKGAAWKEVSGTNCWISRVA